MIWCVKQPKLFYLLHLNPKIKLLLCPKELYRPVRLYSKDGRGSWGNADSWRKQSPDNPSPTRRMRPSWTLPDSIPSTQTETNENSSNPSPERKTLVDIPTSGELSGRRPFSVAQPQTKEPLECLTAAHYCPTTNKYTGSGTTTRACEIPNPCTTGDCPPFRQTDACPTLAPPEDLRPESSYPTQSCQPASPETAATKTPVCAAGPPQASTPPQCGPTKPFPASDASNSEHKTGGGGGGPTKWFLGLLALALGGAAAFYVFSRDDTSVGTREEENRKSRRFIRNRLIPSFEKYPASSDDLPKKVQYLLIGGGTASFSAFRSIKSLDPKAEVLVVGAEPEFPYMRPPLSKEMWNSDRQMRDQTMFRQWNGSVRSVFFEPDSFYMEPKTLSGSSKGGVAVARGWTITKIDATNNQVTLDDGSVITYGKCLLAPGSKPKPLPLIDNAGSEVQERVFYFRDVSDFRDLSHVTECGKRIIIIGGGFLGSELACSLIHNGCEVTQVFRESGLLAKLLPTYLSKWLTSQVRSEGVEILPEAEVKSVVATNGHLQFTLSNGRKVEGDYCVVATGAVPNTDLAEPSNLETHSELGGYVVNSEMLARSNLYIAGDAACFHDERWGRRRVEHHDHAVVSGRQAGENMVGAAKPYGHVSMVWSDLSPDLGWEGVGILDPTLPTTGVFARPKSQEEKAEDDTASPKKESTDPASKPLSEENLSKGVIFYLKDGVIVGVLLWNLFNRMQVARQILKQKCKYEDLNEVAKLFQIHDE